MFPFVQLFIFNTNFANDSHAERPEKKKYLKTGNILTNKTTRNTCIQQPLARLTKERFENENISIFPTFQETVGSHLKPSLSIVVITVLLRNNLSKIASDLRSSSVSSACGLHLAERCAYWTQSSHRVR